MTSFRTSVAYLCIVARHTCCEHIMEITHEYVGVIQTESRKQYVLVATCIDGDGDVHIGSPDDDVGGEHVGDSYFMDVATSNLRT